MSSRTSAARPGSARPGRARLVAARVWDNRPNLGTAACLLAGPGMANVLLGWSLWWTAAVHWSGWLLLMLAVSRPDTDDAPARSATASQEGDQ